MRGILTVLLIAQFARSQERLDLAIDFSLTPTLFQKVSGYGDIESFQNSPSLRVA